MEKPVVKLIGEDGNIFNLLGICTRALKRNKQEDLVPEMVEKVTSSNSYDEALAALLDYVDVK